ncbi:MAG: hypothetical protein KG003_08050 [Bacteroidetes bacterium]|nr:hypothetical protein [Bacteroidota bacterium]
MNEETEVDSQAIEEIEELKIDILPPEKPKKVKGNLKDKKTSKGKPTPKHIIAAIIGAYLSGKYQSQLEIADAVGTSISNVENTISSIPKEYIILKDEAVNQRIALKVVEFIEEGFESLKHLDNHFRNEAWLMNQDAEQLGKLYGIKADKIRMIMEAIERANRSGGE